MIKLRSRKPAACRLVYHDEAKRKLWTAAALLSHTQSFVSFFFFFQAEDGIRDKLVTGVQTCALPISARRLARTVRAGRVDRLPVPPRLARPARGAHPPGKLLLRRQIPPAAHLRQRRRRSEERRVGKECRSRWSPYH